MINSSDQIEALEALQLINSWRSAHQYPLQVFTKTLRRRAERIDPQALIASRTKRLASIEAKLRKQGNMQLARVNDIGGCRAIVSSIEQVDRLVALYEGRSTKTGIHRPTYDYITTPKPSGYRGVHVVYKYQGDSESREPYNGMLIEIQIRSQLQHIWATALETVDTFTAHGLKASNGDHPEWERLFALMGSVFAMKENRPLVKETPQSLADIKRELGPLSRHLRVKQVLRAFDILVQGVTQRQIDYNPPFNLFLLTLKTTFGIPGSSVSIDPFSTRQLLEAQRAYEMAEKKSAGDPNVQVVLVSVRSIEALPRAYPNYFLDTRAFVRELRAVDAE